MNLTLDKVRVRIVFATCALMGIAALMLSSGRIHRLGMEWASSELFAHYSGAPRGIVRSLLSPQTIEEWARYHRDALVKQERLIYRQYRFEQIPCPSPAAAEIQ